MPRIGLDVTMLARQRTGVENYIGTLAEYLPVVANDIEFAYFSAHRIADQFAGARALGSDSSSYARWRQTTLPRLLNEHKVDLFHSPITALPLTWSGPVVTTIQDVIWSKHPETNSFRRNMAHRVWCALAVRKACRIIVPSQATAQDLEALHPRVVPRKVAIIHDCLPARQQDHKKHEDPAALLQRLQIQPPFLLAVGTIQPRKNYERLIAAFERLVQRGLPRHQLVIVGRNGFGADRVHEAAKRSALASDIRLVGYLADNETTTLYRGAAVFVYPSVYEGFGLPLLEAMEWATPVASSDASSMPEVGGDAAAYFDPRDVNEMSQVLHRLLTDQSLRGELIRKGRERVKLFAPQRMATETIALYRKALADSY